MTLVLTQYSEQTGTLTLLEHIIKVLSTALCGAQCSCSRIITAGGDIITQSSQQGNQTTKSTQDLLETTSKISVNPAHYSVIG